MSLKGPSGPLRKAPVDGQRSAYHEHDTEYLAEVWGLMQEKVARRDEEDGREGEERDRDGEIGHLQSTQVEVKGSRFQGSVEEETEGELPGGRPVSAEASPEMRKDGADGVQDRAGYGSETNEED
jgi:hypothetical protein